MSGSAFHPDWQDVTESRAAMHAGGWHVVPVHEASKAPVFANWPSYRYKPATPEPPIPKTRRRDGQPTRAVHRGTGAITTGIVALDIDIDVGERAHRARVAFETVTGEPSPLVRYREGSSRRLLLFRADAEQPPRSISRGDDTHGKIELFAAHGGRQVFLLGRHPSGKPLLYEGDAPPDWPVRELPILTERSFMNAFGAAVEAAGIAPLATKNSPEGVRRQASETEAVQALGEQMRRLITGESIHRASNAAADLMAFHLGFDGEQIASVLWAVSQAARTVNPKDVARYDELSAKAADRGAWYARVAAETPEDSGRLGYWEAARIGQFKRAWRALPDGLKRAFLASAIARQVRADA